MMNTKEISRRLYAINDALLTNTGKKGVWGGLEVIISDDVCKVDLRTEYETSGKYLFGTGKGETPEAALGDAEAIVAALPPLHVTRMNDHMARLAGCIDKAHDDGIADEFVTPLRMTVKAMTDNLLTKGSAQ
jgi:hypothetical protein